MSFNPKYGVHVGTCTTARDYFGADNLKDVRAALAEFVAANDVVPSSASEGEPAAWASVYIYDARDNAYMTHGDYPVAMFELGPRGGIRRVAL